MCVSAKLAGVPSTKIKAKSRMSSEKIQTVFLLDTSSLPKQNLQQYHRLLCLVCTRILLFLAQFPNKEHLSRVRWNYKFFNSQRPEKSIRARTAQFYECRSEFLQSFFAKLQNSLEAAWDDREPAPSCSTSNPARCVYSALASAVHDFIWDAPEILSPVRPVSGRNQKGVRGRRSGGEETDMCRNLIFVCSPCPNNKEELNRFCSSELSFEGRGRGRSIVMECLQSELLPRALLSQLTARGIAVHWVDTIGSLSSSEARPGVCQVLLNVRVCMFVSKWLVLCCPKSDPGQVVSPQLKLTYNSTMKQFTQTSMTT